ncbi:MAG: glycosyltransferase [Opitutales bacterium]
MSASFQDTCLCAMRWLKVRAWAVFGWLLGYRSWECYKVTLRWMLKLRWRRLGSRRPRIGFGPITTVERRLDNRKWEIDPFVDHVNAHSDAYDADIFFVDSDLSRFDAIVLVREFEYLGRERLEALKASGVKLLYNTSDNIIYDRNYLTESWLIPLFDGVVSENPLTYDDVKDITPTRYIPTPIISHGYKKSYEQKGPIQIIWDGFKMNLHVDQFFNPLIHRLIDELGRDIRMIYHVDVPTRQEGPIQYLAWDKKLWEPRRMASDIAIALKASDDFRKQRKPGAKVQTYMATGLPVVCTPSRADLELIEHGETGFFAYNEDDWYELLKELVCSQELRERVGRAARQEVVERFSVPTLGTKYLEFFDELGVGKRGNEPAKVMEVVKAS